MRDDMFKVIVERPRWASRHARSVKLKRDRDDRASVGLKRHAKECADYTKALNENLAPLIRFLQRRIGMRWDDVFSEICAGLDTGSTVKMHVRQHLDDFVLSRISRGRNGEWMHDGHVLRPDTCFRSSRQLFVDPKDGVLKDRVWFWRDRGIAAPASRRELRWSSFR
jgi:hypothetical protein